MDGTKAKQEWSDSVLPTLATALKPAQEDSVENEPVAASPRSGTSESPGSPLSESSSNNLFAGHKEAWYLVYYISELSGRIGICDPDQLFRSEVPKRAYHHPLLGYSVLTFSSRMWSMKSGKDDPACDKYYGNALRLLIPRLDDPIELIDDNVLASIVFLRLSEESFLGNDAGAHLLGSTRLLQSARSLAPLGGLGEAVSWLLLRQDIFITLTRSQPLRSNVSGYVNSRSFWDSTPEALGNRVIYLCAHILLYTVQAEEGLDQATWTELNGNLQTWYDTAPAESRPYYVHFPKDTADEPSVFPTAWFTRPVYMLAYQHYYLSRLLLAAFDPRVWKPDPETLRKRAQVEEEVRTNLDMVLGLAINGTTPDACSFTAHHLLYMYGSWVEQERQRGEVLGFLRCFHERTGWETRYLEDKLTKKVWVKAINEQ